MNSSALKYPKAKEIDRAVNLIMEVGVLKLNAINTKCRMARFYTIRIDRNLWNQITICTSYGRIGTHGNTKYEYFEEAKEAQVYLRSVIRKRLNSEKRIGVGYREINVKHLS